ncbi:MAG: DegT/DnrJ/EryC1/StrS aminotransferase family protein [bacterium]|nr:DegT/DnrJ/EryC1/StrS aminotransferase family protein [bacterium]
MTLNLPLMENNITREDLNAVIDFLKQEPAPILTNSKKCQEFEKAWSEWLGCKYSVFVNSGSAANSISMHIIKELYGEGEVIVPPLTWVSDILAVMRAGLTPKFVDVNKHHLAMDEDQILNAINSKTKAVFLTHVLGFNGLSDKLLNELQKRNIPLVEDVCESHGATFKNKKLGSFGCMSNFSFYFAHHMSTIEGGMVCTDDEKIYQMARMFRSHGMIREATDENIKTQWSAEHTDLRPEFIFAYPGYNFRSTEINAVMGLSQLPNLDANNKKRTDNFNIFLEGLDRKKYFTDFITEGSCNYAFTLLLNDPDKGLCERLITKMSENKVEFRRGMSGGGNQLRQPYLMRALGKQDLSKFPVVDHIHYFGFYIGNFPTLKPERVIELCKVLNSVK